jgi:hypothetical protein
MLEAILPDSLTLRVSSSSCSVYQRLSEEVPPAQERWLGAFHSLGRGRFSGHSAWQQPLRQYQGTPRPTVPFKISVAMMVSSIAAESRFKEQATKIQSLGRNRLRPLLLKA